MICSGKVLKTNGEIASVLVEATACESCGACGIASLKDRKHLEVRALNKAGAKEGDQVSLEVSGKKVMKASAILFMIPFSGFIIGFVLGYFIAPHIGFSKTPTGLFIGFALLAASYYLVYLLGSKSEFEFVIEEILNKSANLDKDSI